MADRTRSGRHFAGLASIRARLTAAACLVVAGALLVGAAVILTVLRHTLDENLDDAAVQRAKDVAAQVESSTLDTPSRSTATRTPTSTSAPPTATPSPAPPI